LRNLFAVVALCAALVSVPAYAQKSSKKSTAKATVLKTTGDSVCYSIGVMIGKNLKQQEMPFALNADMIAAGIADMLGDRTTTLTEAQMEALMKSLQATMAQAQTSKLQKDAVENKRAGEEFLKQNAQRKGVVTLASGLQYEVITDGTGPKPTASDNVTTHYKGTLLDGTTFDSSYDRGEPATFKLDQVIKGWTEALQLMSVGSKWRLFVPSELAYGEGGAPGSPIGPNATLIFEVELLKIN
jgi:FKBP-type peptidyl-prolyl cis-trans isomerase